MSMIQIRGGDLQVGSTLRWAVYDAQNRLLLQKGSVIASARQLESLLLRGIFRSDTEGGTLEPPRSVEDKSSPFERLDDLMRRVPKVLGNIIEGREQSGERAAHLARELRELYDRFPDAMIGAVHLCHEYEYTQCHPIHTAILVEMMARKRQLEPELAQSLVAAALTQNISMLRIQDILQRQAEGLTEPQRAAIRSHPERSVQMLRAVGVKDEAWLRAVLEHHERVDGTGYPRGLKAEQICEGAHLLALADRYAAMISARAYRDALSAGEALKSFYLNKGQESGEAVTLMFIQELGIYPPGSFVQLNTGEIGVVVKRGKTGLQPVVAAYIAPRGAPYPRPFRRDCAVDTYEIRRPCSPDTGIQISLGALWSV